MGKIKCELCGSSDIVKENDLFVCRQCGTKYTVEEAQKLIGREGGGVPAEAVSGKDRERENWLVLARRARAAGDNTNAVKYYGLILEQEPSNWEAAFFQKYFEASDCRLAGLALAINTIVMAYATSLSLICELGTDEEKLSALKEISDASMDFADKVGAMGVGYKQQNSANQYSQQSANEWMFHATKLYITVTTCLEGKAAWLNTPEAKAYAVVCWKRYNYYLAKYGDVLKSDYRRGQMSAATQHIRELDPNYEEPDKESTRPGACYVATCVYGSYDCPQVWTLRRYRDRALASTACGRLFIRCYYAVSPSLVKAFGKKEFFRSFCKIRLDRFVRRLNRSGYEDTPYRDRA